VAGKGGEMMIILVMEDGSSKQIGDHSLVVSLERLISREDVKTIVFGELQGDKVAWEKQFEAVTVIPSSFGKPK
jgi:hypothetical protein